MKITPKRQALIAAIRAHAVANYGRGGWDVIVEAFDDAQISEVIGRARTLKGALKKFAPVNDVIADRRSQHDAEIRAAVGHTEQADPQAAHYVIQSTSLYPYDGAVDCSCGREFFTEKAADLHAAEANKAIGCYDSTTQGHHPDGSFVSWRHDEHSGEAWATRTYPGKGGRGHIAIVETEDGYLTTERYQPGWRGVTVYSANHCDFDASVPF
jgi:hypothetical protein